MKQFSLLAACCLMAILARAATFSGTVTNASTGLPAAGQKVYLSDTVLTYADSAVTNASGAYSITLPAALPIGPLEVSTSACGVTHRQMYFYTGGNITHNFTVCVPSATFTLNGTVSLGGPPNNGAATLYLLRKQYDSTISDTVLVLVDTFNTAPTGGSFSKTYSVLPFGSLLLKAALRPTHPAFASYLPTYFGSALVWSIAPRLPQSNFNSTVATNITMTRGLDSSGPGFIGGSVLVGANKGTAVGDPLSKRLLLLTDAGGKAVSYAYSNTSGLFTFENLALGTYKIFGDAWGKSNPALTLTITAVRPSVSNVLFEENDKTFKGTLPGLGMTQGALGGLSVYPNPVKDDLRISGLDAIKGRKTLVLSDMTGAVISRHIAEREGMVSIPAAQLPAGIYLLQIQTSEGSALYKIAK
jgi:hypothetical protein